MQIAEAYMKS